MACLFAGACGCGSKFKSQLTEGVKLLFHLPGFHFGPHIHVKAGGVAEAFDKQGGNKIACIRSIRSHGDPGQSCCFLEPPSNATRGISNHGVGTCQPTRLSGAGRPCYQLQGPRCKGPPVAWHLALPQCTQVGPIFINPCLLIWGWGSQK